jgi:1,4-alpha-glucan branching enzyme
MSKRVLDMNKPAGRPATAAHQEVTFILPNHEAGEVYLCGDFNQWSPRSLPMIRHEDNRGWQKRLTLLPGRNEYKFLVDGHWLHDPQGRENVSNIYGSLNSVVEVRP